MHTTDRIDRLPEGYEAWIWPEGGQWRAHTQDGRDFMGDRWQTLFEAVLLKEGIEPPHIAAWQGPHMEEIAIIDEEVLTEPRDGGWVDIEDLEDWNAVPLP